MICCGARPAPRDFFIRNADTLSEEFPSWTASERLCKDKSKEDEIETFHEIQPECNNAIKWQSSSPKVLLILTNRVIFSSLTRHIHHGSALRFPIAALDLPSVALRQLERCSRSHTWSPSISETCRCIYSTERKSLEATTRSSGPSPDRKSPSVCQGRSCRKTLFTLTIRPCTELTQNLLKARELARYGEMTTTHLGSKLWVVLNSHRLAVELYNRRGSVTNGRPPYPVVGGLMSRDKRSVLMQPGEWSEQRRIMHQLLSGTAMTRYQGFQDEESIRLLLGYTIRPSQWFTYHHRYANSVVHRIAFGERPIENDVKVKALARAQKVFLMNGPPMNIIDCFPALAQLPTMLQWWRKKYEDLGQMTYDAYSAYWNPIRDSIKAGKGHPSFARDIVAGKSKFTGGDDEAMYLTMQLIEAGSDTTRLALNIFVLAALTHRGQILKARAEVDAICGDAERLPQFEDESEMPYIGAFAKELFRWRPFLVWTPEHTLTEDLSFEGYLFPKGTSFVINQINIAQNPELVDDPESFKPERWLDGHQSDITNGLWQFGGGRRVCVGYRLAQKSLFINIARLVYCFDYEAVSACLNLLLHKQYLLN